MHVRLVLPSSMDATVKKEDDCFHISPVFFSPSDYPTIAFLEVLDEAGQVTQRALLQVSGRTAGLRLIDRSQSVRPHYDVQTYPGQEQVKPTAKKKDSEVKKQAPKETSSADVTNNK